MTDTLFEWEELYHKPKVSLEKARASRLPAGSGEGCYFGGGAVLTIGVQSFLIGEGDGAFELAQEIARRWNAAGPHVLAS